LDKGHTLYLDNWYSSPDLYRRLTERKTNVIGTVRPNRRDVPQDISKTKLKRGEHEIWSANNILCVKWKDNRDVHFLSTKISQLIWHAQASWSENGVKPKCALEYQKGMGRGWPTRSLFPVMRRTVKAYRKIFFYLLVVCIFNSFTVYHKVTGKKKTRYTDFKKKHWTVAGKHDVTGLLYLGSTFSPANTKTWAHFIARISPTERKKCVTRMCCLQKCG
jgi:hypothetical protein